MHEVCCCDEVANHQLPVAEAFWIQIVSTEECSSLTQNLMHVRCSTHSVILNVMATQYTCSLSGVYCPHWLVTVKLSLFTHAHSSPLSSAASLHGCCTNCSHYINNGWTFSGHTSCVCVDQEVKVKNYVQHLSQTLAVNNDGFTVPVSGGGRHHWLSMCTVWPCIQNDSVSRATSLHQILC